MARRKGGRSGGSFGGGLFSSRKSPAAASTRSRNTSAPAPAAPAPPPAPVLGGGSATGGRGSLFADGMAIGAGSAIGHRAVDAIAGSLAARTETVASPVPAPESATMATSNNLGGPDACGAQFKAFEDCLNSYRSEVSKCQIYMDMLSECRENSGSGLNA